MTPHQARTRAQAQGAEFENSLAHMDQLARLSTLVGYYRTSWLDAVEKAAEHVAPPVERKALVEPVFVSLPGIVEDLVADVEFDGDSDEYPMVGALWLRGVNILDAISEEAVIEVDTQVTNAIEKRRFEAEADYKMAQREAA
jgi:hypothetical protein